jgi:hypothetical protein
MSSGRSKKVICLHMASFVWLCRVCSLKSLRMLIENEDGTSGFTISCSHLIEFTNCFVMEVVCRILDLWDTHVFSTVNACVCMQCICLMQHVWLRS